MGEHTVAKLESHDQDFYLKEYFKNEKLLFWGEGKVEHLPQPSVKHLVSSKYSWAPHWAHPTETKKHLPPLTCGINENWVKNNGNHNDSF